MKAVLMTPESKRVVIDTKTDPCLYSSPQNPPNTGTTYTRGTDLYYHKSRAGNEYFYFKHWSMWQGEEGSIQLITKDKAEDFLLEKAGNSGWDSLNESDFENLKEFGFNLLEETA
ncbi:MAG: hypothetical protein ACFFDN_05280 [Candidatus Hodarchaeota archaeon]